MFIPFENIPVTAKIWLYQSNVILDTKQLDFINHQLKNFIENWTAHQQSLTASFQIIQNKIILLAVDENFHQASGCSIDSSVKVIKMIEQALNISLFNRDILLENEANQLFNIPLSAIKASIETNQINDKTYVYDLTVTNLKDWNERGKILAKNSWLKRYFPKEENITL
jgi:hypothetical protein